MSQTSLVMGLTTLAIAACVFLFAWLNGPEAIKVFKRFERAYLERLHVQLDAIYSRTDPKRYFYRHLIVVVLFMFSFSLLLGPLVGLLLGILAFMWPWLTLSKARRKRRERIEEMLPDALVSMGNSLRAGLTLAQALDILVDNTDPPISEEFGLLMKEHRLGLTLDEAMNNMSARVKSKNLDLVVTSIAVSRRTGGNLPQVFEDTATAIREIGRLESKIATMTSQGKLQAIVLGGLPFGMGAMIFWVDPTMIVPLWEDPIGWVILFFIFVFEIIGVFMIRKIVTVDV